MPFRHIQLSSGDPLPGIGDFSPFKAVVVIEERVDPQWQAAASAWLAESGCRYMMAWGRDCSSWDISVDIANFEQFDYGEIPEEEFIMTTWHEHEPIEEVIRFAKMCAYHPTVELNNVLCLYIGSGALNFDFEAIYEAA